MSRHDRGVEHGGIVYLLVCWVLLRTHDFFGLEKNRRKGFRPSSLRYTDVGGLTQLGNAAPPAPHHRPATGPSLNDNKDGARDDEPRKSEAACCSTKKKRRLGLVATVADAFAPHQAEDCVLLVVVAGRFLLL